MQGRPRRRRLVRGGLLAALGGLLAFAAPASAGQKVLKPASYPDLTTYRCMSEPLDLVPGQNLNLLGTVKTCPNAEKIKGPGDVSVFDSSAEGYMTRFEPSMVEVKDNGKLVTPSVWDLHLHHAVWLSPKRGDGPSFAVGEEKTIVTLPQGYGYKVRANSTWGLNYMIHSLNASTGREVRLTWEIDWVPASSPSAGQIGDTRVRWMDVAGYPEHLYPVFDAERGFDRNGDGKYTFPDEVPTDPSEPGYEERSKIGHHSRVWTVPEDVVLAFAAGHLHPGGKSVDISVTRNGVVKPLFRSDAHYYEPAGAVSWDVALEATPRDWRVSLKAGDKVTISTTYNIKRASWYESMGIMPILYTTADDPKARDPFDDAAEVAAMYDKGRSGELTHGRLPENIDRKARNNLKLPDPRKLPRKGKLGNSGVKIKSFLFKPGGYSATRGFPRRAMRPPVVKAGRRVKFTNLDALPSSPQDEQAWHSVTSCKPPCNKGLGIGYPLANGPIKFDSGELGFGKFLSEEVTAGTNVFKTPPLKAPNKAAFNNSSLELPRLKGKKKGGRRAKTYTYFCRIHPFMRGSIRVVPKKKNAKRG